MPDHYKTPCMKTLTLLMALTLLGTASFAQQHKPKTAAKKTQKTTVKHPPKKQITEPPPIEVSEEAVEVIDLPPPTTPSSAPAAKEVYGINEALEKVPEFSGGHQGLYRYLSTNLQYPSEAQSADIQGKVVVSFTVCEDGRLCDEKIMQSLGGGCDEEALRVIKAMPKWEPGIKDGKPVKVRYMLPVVFQLQ